MALVLIFQQKFPPRLTPAMSCPLRRPCWHLAGPLSTLFISAGETELRQVLEQSRHLSPPCEKKTELPLSNAAITWYLGSSSGREHDVYSSYLLLHKNGRLNIYYFIKFFGRNLMSRIAGHFKLEVLLRSPLTTAVVTIDWRIYF